MRCYAHPDIAGLLAAFYRTASPRIWRPQPKRCCGSMRIRKTASRRRGRLYRVAHPADGMTFTQDADVLMASFRQAYGIDLENGYTGGNFGG